MKQRTLTTALAAATALLATPTHAFAAATDVTGTTDMKKTLKPVAAKDEGKQRDPSDVITKPTATAKISKGVEKVIGTAGASDKGMTEKAMANGGGEGMIKHHGVAASAHKAGVEKAAAKQKPGSGDRAQAAGDSSWKSNPATARASASFVRPAAAARTASRSGHSERRALA